MNIAQQIRAWRQYRGLSQQAVATHFGISRPAVAAWESEADNATRPDFDKLPQLAALFGCTIDALLLSTPGGHEPGVQEPRPAYLEELSVSALTAARLFARLPDAEQSKMLSYLQGRIDFLRATTKVIEINDKEAPSLK